NSHSPPRRFGARGGRVDRHPRYRVHAGRSRQHIFSGWAMAHPSQEEGRMKTIRIAIDAFTARLELWAAEVRAGITLVETVAASKRMVELRAVGDVDEMLDIAITAAKLGLREDDLEPMARAWFTTQGTSPVGRNT